MRNIVFVILFCVVGCTIKPTKPSFLVRDVRVSQTQTPQQALKETGCVQYYIEQKVVDAMPKAEAEEVEVFLICFNKGLSVNQLEQEVDELGFKLVDPITLCELNKQDPALVETITNATQWRDENGRTYYAAFSCWNGKRWVAVRQDAYDWVDNWFFGCVRK